MEKLYYSYEIFLEDTKTLVNLTKNYQADTFLAISRGGLTLAHFMANAQNIRKLFTINSISYDNTTQKNTHEIFNIPNLKGAKKVLIIDDIVDSGATMQKILELLKSEYKDIEFKVATLFYKDGAIIRPDFFVKQNSVWIDFFWEVDI